MEEYVTTGLVFLMVLFTLCVAALIAALEYIDRMLPISRFSWSKYLWVILALALALFAFNILVANH